MAFAELFETALEDMKEDSLASLMSSLSRAAAKMRLSAGSDERRFLAIISYLLGVADYETRVQVAEVVLNLDGLPSDMYLYFACDTFKIAEPFLGSEFNLSEENLIHIAKYCSSDHRLALLEREDLSQKVRLEILRHNEISIISKMNEDEASAIFFEYDDVMVMEEDDNSLEGYGFELGGELEIENPLDIMLKGFVENSRFTDIIDLLARTGGISKEMVKGMFSRKEVEPISIYCRGIGIGDEAFAALARYRCRRLGQLERLAETAMEAYEEISLEYAEAMLVDLKSQTPQLARKMSA